MALTRLTIRLAALAIPLVILFADLGSGLRVTLGFYDDIYFRLPSAEQSLLLVFGPFVGTIFALPPIDRAARPIPIDTIRRWRGSLRSGVIQAKQT